MEFLGWFVKEWGTVSLAAYGAGMSTIMAARDYRRNHPQLEVRLHGAKLHVRNVGAAAVFMRGVGYIAEDWTYVRIPYTLVPPPSDPSDKGRLDRWQEVVILTDLRTDIATAMKIPRAWWAQDQSGAIFTSYSALHPMRLLGWWKRPREK